MRRGQRSDHRNRTARVRTSISKVQFPEMCPVCMASPEDLVSVTVIEKSIYQKRATETPSVWSAGKSVPDPALRSGRVATFWVPTCMRHGSGKLRTLRTRLVPILIFFILFYPALYFTLALASAQYNPKPILEPLIGLVVTVGLMLGTAFYGFYPRALERTLRFVDIDTIHDRVFIEIRNDRYAKMFLELNAMHSELLGAQSRGSETRTNNRST